MVVTVAAERDLPAVERLYRAVIEEMHGAPHDVWWEFGVHPTREGLRASASRGELIAASLDLPEIVRELDVDSLHYLSIDGLLRSVMHSDSYCLACFNGDYPVPCREAGKHRLEQPCAAVNS